MLKLIGKKVLVKYIAPPDLTKVGGLFVKTPGESTAKGQVIESNVPELKLNDIVYYRQFITPKLEKNGITYHILGEDDVMAYEEAANAS